MPSDLFQKLFPRWLLGNEFSLTLSLFTFSPALSASPNIWILGSGSYVAQAASNYVSKNNFKLLILSPLSPKCTHHDAWLYVTSFSICGFPSFSAHRLGLAKTPKTWLLPWGSDTEERENEITQAIAWRTDWEAGKGWGWPWLCADQGWQRPALRRAACEFRHG